MERQCERCGAKIVAVRASKRLCGDCRRVLTRLAAKRQWERKRASAMVARENLVCQSCGTTFRAQRGDAKFCPSCRPLQHEKYIQAHEERKRHPCPDCGVLIARTSVRCKPCGTKTATAKRSGENHVAWKGGRARDKYGYVHLLVAPEARKGHRYQPEHRLVWEAAHGPIPEGYVIHHVNGVKDDNRLENLEAMPRKKHNHRHDEHDRRIQELEAEIARLRRQLT